jgi:hypothetical protein
VCLRCQLSLASPGRARPLPPQLFNNRTAIHNAPRRAYSDSADSSKPEAPSFESYFEPKKDDRQKDSTQPTEPTEPTEPTPGKDQEFQVRRVVQEGRRNHLSPRMRADREPIYQSKGQRLKPTEQNLPIDILGKPGHAIVMRDVGPRRKRLMQQLIEASDPTLSSFDTAQLSQIYQSAEQLDPPSSDEVLRNIDELKPESSVIPRRDFETLQKKLSDGFTKTQLATYIARHAMEARKKDGKRGKTKPWVLEQWAWAPENQTPGTADALLTGYLSKSPSPKDRLVVGLMRRCWGLSAQELQSRQGHLDVKVKDLQFDLLMLGNRRWLESISTSLFEPGTQIELIRSERIVRIAAPKATAEFILKEIYALLEKAESRLLDASKVSPEQLEPSVLEEVGRMTNTVVQPTKSGSKIQVSWLPVAEPAQEGLEDLGDVVYRLLLSGYGFQHPGETSLDVHPDHYAVGGWYLRDYHSKGKMAWKDRLSEWGRWTIATPRWGAKPAITYDALPSTILSRPLDASSAPSFDKDGWSSQPQVTTRAVFGHVLHKEPAERFRQPAEIEEPEEEAPVSEEPQEEAPAPQEPPTAEAEMKSLDPFWYKRNTDIHDKLIPDLTRTLAPMIPPLTCLAALTAASKATTPSETTILMRFLPVPNKSTSSPLPSLELTLSNDPSTPDSDISISSLTATTSVDTHDILLPSHPVDIRLQHTTSHLLPSEAVSTHLPQIISFLNSSDLRPSDGVLVTPARFAKSLRLPGRLVGEEEVVKAEYVFAGLEMRRSVATEVDGWRLVYTSVEAGQGGGRRAELALEGGRMEGEGEGDKEGFVGVLNKLTVEGGLKWFGDGPRSDGEITTKGEDDGRVDEER